MPSAKKRNRLEVVADREQEMVHFPELVNALCQDGFDQETARKLAIVAFFLVNRCESVDDEFAEAQLAGFVDRPVRLRPLIWGRFIIPVRGNRSFRITRKFKNRIARAERLAVRYRD